MTTMPRPLNKYRNKLENRVLCGDGDSIVNPQFLYEHLLKGGSVDGIFVSKKFAESEEVNTYNAKNPDEKISAKESVREPSREWVIPSKFKELDVKKYLTLKFKKEIKESSFSKSEIKKRYYRLRMELRIWEERDLMDLLRTLIYIVNTFEKQNVIWGTGRGSSCASYILYLIGLHQVDSVLYDLDISEFFR